MATSRTWTALTVTLVLAAAAWRLAGIDTGPTGDEVANVDPRGFAAIWSDPETGVNPPLYRWLMNVAPRGWEVAWGRSISMLAGLTTVGLAAEATRRLTAGQWPILAALPLFVLVPHHHAVVHATEARAYGLLGLLLVGQAFALDAAVRDDRPARWAALAALVAASVWTHYLAWPVIAGLLAALAITAPWRRALVIAAAAAASAAPLVSSLLTPSPQRHLPDEPWPKLLAKLVRFDLDLSPDVLAPLMRPLPPRIAEYGPSSAGVILVVVLLASRLVGRRSPLERALLGQWLALIAACAWIGSFQNVRPPVVGLSLVLALPSILAATAAWRFVPFAPLLLWLGHGAANLREHAPVTPPHGQWAEALRAEIAAHPPAQVRLRPGWLTSLYAYELLGVPLNGYPDRTGCPDGAACFTLDGARIIGDEYARDGGGWVLVEREDDLRPEELACPPGPPPAGGHLRECPP